MSGDRAARLKALQDSLERGRITTAQARMTGPLFTTRAGRRMGQPEALKIIRRLAARVDLEVSGPDHPVAALEPEYYARSARAREAGGVLPEQGCVLWSRSGAAVSAARRALKGREEPASVRLRSGLQVSPLLT